MHIAPAGALFNFVGKKEEIYNFQEHRWLESFEKQIKRRGERKKNYGCVRLQEETIDVPRDYADQARKRK